MASHFLFIKMKEEKKITEILSKVERYCRYQERCKSEVEKKLVDLEVTEKMKKSILYELAKKKYFDNNRFSYEYAIGKFRNNKWGKIKISYHLKCKSIDKSIIDKALKKIPENEYTSVFNKMAKKEWVNRSKLDLSSRKRRFVNALKSRGWEFFLINKFLLETTKK
ncbi:MAG: hypothetical protein EVA36_02515 [Flavobacteriales bacterium]|nr:MAG: hypothetical protein EVA36_02515 [Flavobacteriales bacterium]